jgi:(2R)-sulfolactate sulfo-lyase subunit beta
MTQKFWGYRRANGRVGIRNHVIILPLDDISNACAESVAKNVQGTMALPHHFGRLQFGRDLDLFFRTLIGIGSNPNVAACVVIGIEASNWTQKVADEIAKTGKPVAMFGIERHGDLNTIERASRKAKEFVHYATELRREECDISELVASVKCGESDTTSGLASCPTTGKVVERLVAAGASVSFGETTELTGGENIVADRMKTPEARAKFQKMFDDYQAVIEREQADLLGSSRPRVTLLADLPQLKKKPLATSKKSASAWLTEFLKWLNPFLRKMVCGI